MANEIAPVLMNIFLDSLDQGSLPAIWKTAAVVHIFKKGKSLIRATTDQYHSPVFVQKS